MDAKKSPKADLESKRFLFTQIGLIIALTISLLAFEWKSYEKVEFDLESQEIEDIQEELMPVTEQKTKPKLPPPPKQVTVINLVEDDEEIDDDFEFDADADLDTEIEEFVPIEMADEEIDEETIFVVYEKSPMFPGGPSAMNKFLAKNIEYPTMARESGIQGTVYLSFVVEIDGSITDVKAVRGIGGGCNEEAVRVVKKMPKWTPGEQRGRAVRVQFSLPVKFILQ